MKCDIYSFRQCQNEYMNGYIMYIYLNNVLVCYRTVGYMIIKYTYNKENNKKQLRLCHKVRYHLFWIRIAMFSIQLINILIDPSRLFGYYLQQS